MWWRRSALPALLVVAIAHTFNYNRDYFYPAEEVATIESGRSVSCLRRGPDMSDAGLPKQRSRAGLACDRGYAHEHMAAAVRPSSASGSI